MRRGRRIDAAAGGALSASEAANGSWSIHPRRSLAAGALWLIVALAVAFSAAAGLWVGRIARDNVVEQHVRRLSLETDQLSSDLGQALASRLGAVRTAQFLLGGASNAPSPEASRRGELNTVFEDLVAAYPELDWIAVADTGGAVAAAREVYRPGDQVAAAAWFAAGLSKPWVGVIDGQAATNTDTTSATAIDTAMGEVSMPVRDRGGTVIGVIAAHLRWRHARNPSLRLTDETGPRGAARAFVLDRDLDVLIGPRSLRGKRWEGVPIPGERAAGIPPTESAVESLHFEQMPGGERALVCRAPIETGAAADLGWQVLLSEPRERVFQRADAVALRILQVSLCLGAATCALGAIGAMQLTRRLKRLTESVATAGRNEDARIELPGGEDEVARLATAFDRVYSDLQRERRELKALSGELERRVAVRTREVQRLAEDSRYAAIVRERLKIARDLHDTLAHSMMAMLSEVRFLRKLQARDPAAVAKELAHAEEVAHEGLNEARSAIAQMRAGTVRESGLGPALAALFERFIDRTGITGEYSADGEAARFGDERAETLLRMAQEALRNIERHARATRAELRLRVVDGNRLELRVEDNGAGFDASAPSPGHFGLVGLREQADVIGADLAIDSRAGRGTVVTVTVRLSPIAFGERSSEVHGRQS
ncbi:MAG TPA: histidine kinase [Steroidobacteraceae bacterium]|nr:histidine kinase [Steroidobacteraceae bacterium]